MGSEAKLKQFQLEGVAQVNPDEDDYDLGHGSYGYVVEMQFRGLQCAGKKFFRDLYCHGNVEERERVMARCYDECLMLCSLSHPNIVQFLGITSKRDNPLPILVMEFVPFTLSHYLQEKGIFPEDISLSILKDVATGLCYLHGRKPIIIHRDLSANNILLTSEMKAKIADLGMAKIINATPAKSKCPGTAAYMPPEALVENPEYCTEIDLFSYGVLIIHTLCGQWPHPGQPKGHKHDGTLVAHSEYDRRIKYISMLGEEHQMLELIRQCLSDEPSKRPNTETILKYVKRVASKYPRQFDSILSLQKHLDFVTYELEKVQNDHVTLMNTNAEVELKCSDLNSQLEQIKAECSLLNKKLESLKRGISNIQINIEKVQKDRSKTLGELFDNGMLLAQEKGEIIGLKRAVEELKSRSSVARQAVMNKAENSASELKLKEQLLELNKAQVDVAQIKSNDEEKCVISECLQSQLDSPQCPKQQNETKKLKIEEERKSLTFKDIYGVLSQTKEMLVNADLELKVLKQSQIPDLKEELEQKKTDIKTLTHRLQKAQEFLSSKEGPFLKLRFKQCADLPMAMSDPQCAVLEDRVYVGGGTGEDKSDHTAQSQVFEYSIIDKKWSLLSHNHARFFGLTTYLGQLVSVGGILQPNDITGKIGVFDFTDKIWDHDKILPMPTKRFYPTVISYGNHLAVCGGVTHGGSTTDMVEVLVNNEQWCRGPKLPYRICRAKPILFDRSCYLIGGDFSEGPLVPSKAFVSIPMSFLIFPQPSPGSDTYISWEYVSHNSSTNYYPAIANLGGVVLMVGGSDHSKLMVPNNKVYAYSAEATMWVRVENLPNPRCSLAATAQLQNGATMLIGGVEKTVEGDKNTKKKSSCVTLMSLRLS